MRSFLRGMLDDKKEILMIFGIVLTVGASYFLREKYIIPKDEFFYGSVLYFSAAYVFVATAYISFKYICERKRRKKCLS